ncbi:hypothetical protein SAMN06295974_3782 [Plantibacter flavus]|uniref:Uncharacterized protein n=1 Tax=Plantibacter flavus TaxID=150123 RepID=A0A3N2BLC8_9MICO|nr:hypothetical protein EDD42_4023 [Plantibacter flavus]SMG48896.1 hypothetical protein SAMN06295974_3782 [Plantibacter flavus]
MMTPQSIRDRYAEFVARQIAGGIEDPAGLLEGSLDVLDDIIAGRETVLAARGRLGGHDHPVSTPVSMVDCTGRGSARAEMGEPCPMLEPRSTAS